MGPVNDFLTDSFLRFAPTLVFGGLVIVCVVAAIVMIFAVSEREYGPFFEAFTLFVISFSFILWILSFIYDF